MDVEFRTYSAIKPSTAILIVIKKPKISFAFSYLYKICGESVFETTYSWLTVVFIFIKDFEEPNMGWDNLEIILNFFTWYFIYKKEYKLIINGGFGLSRRARFPFCRFNCLPFTNNFNTDDYGTTGRLVDYTLFCNQTSSGVCIKKESSSLRPLFVS